MPETLTIDALVALIKEVQPGLEGQQITAAQSVDELGLDSLDLLQLSRRISRDYDLDLDLDAWAEQSQAHHASIESILDFLGAQATA